MDRAADRDGDAASSFVPPPEIRALRVYTRHICDLTADRTRYWQRLEKLLEDALCKLSAVVSRLAGHQTARAVIEAMIAGERDPQVLAALGRGKMERQLPALAGALSGMRFGPEHAHAAASLLRAIDLLEAEPGTCKSGSPRTWPRSPRPGAWTRTALPGRTPACRRTPRSSRPRAGGTRSPAWAGRPPLR